MRWACVTAVAVLAFDASALAQPRTPVAPSEVTPRSLRPEAPPAPPPIVNLEASLPAQAPAGAENLHLTLAHVVVDDGYPDLASAAGRVFAPVEGRQVSVADLYGAARRLEQAYADAGYFLARVVVPKQALADGGDFHVQVIDGFIETVDDDAVPAKLKAPVRALMGGLAGRRRLKLAELNRRLQAAGQLPGGQIRSTIAQGETPGGARLILDGGFTPYGVNLGADNLLGPSFDDWGLNLQLTANSPTGHGEQIYVFLSGSPHLDHAFRQDALRRVGGGGVSVPIGGGGLIFNPEFTISDTHPRSANPILGSHGRLYRGTLNWLFPAPYIDGATAKVTTELVDERQTLPAFGIALSHDRLTVVRADLAWNGSWLDNGITVEGTASKGVSAFGARSVSANLTSEPNSRGSDPGFTKFEGQLGISRSLPGQAVLNLTLRGQTAFGGVLPSSELFDLTGLDSLSSFPAGALSTDAGVSVRAQVERSWIGNVGAFAFGATPYLFLAAGEGLPTAPDHFAPQKLTDYGVGLRIAGRGFPLGGRPTFSVEYGHGQPDRGKPPNNRIYASLGIAF